MQLKSSALSAGILLGLLHGVWHLMAGYLGSAQDLGVYFFPHFVAMWIVAMTVMRVLEAWVYSNTNSSVLLVQLMHTSSLGFLMVLAPSNR